MFKFTEDEKIFIEKKKYVQCDCYFLPQANFNSGKSSEELIIQNKQYLLSNDLDLTCSAINFFSQNISCLDFETLKEIFCINYEDSFNDDCFDAYDCIEKLVRKISKCSVFLENTDYAMIIVNFLIEFSNLEENQFSITAYKSISNFIFSNKDVASLLSNEFLIECFNHIQTFIYEFKCLDNDETVEINDYLSLIESHLQIFSAMFFHPDLITEEFSNMVVKCYHDLLDIESPKDHIFKLKVFIIDNVRCFAYSAPDESIQNLLNSQFIELLQFFLELQELKNDVKKSLFESIAIMTGHSDEFSLFFLHPPIELLSRLDNCYIWTDEVKYSFLKILRNFTACQDISPSLSIIDSSEATEFLKSIFANCSFNAQKVAYMILFNMILTQNDSIIEYVLSTFSEYFQNLIDFLNIGDLFFNQICLYSICICTQYLQSQSEEIKNQFLDMFSNGEWGDLFDKLSLSSDEKLSKLASILNDSIVNEG